MASNCWYVKSKTGNIIVLSNKYTTLLSQLNTLTGNVANIASIRNYYSGLKSSLAVASSND